jgi:putative toxin-antitoxin system antitoxin component (TIGR02293 family)
MTVADVVEVLGGPGVVHAEGDSELEFVNAVRDGLPTSAVDAMLEDATLSLGELEQLVIPRRTLAHRRKLGQRLSRDESDRLSRVARVVASANETFQAREVAARWLRQGNRALGGATPLELLGTGDGARLVEDVLGRIAHGIFR